MTTMERDITTSTVGDIMQHAVTTVPGNMPLSELARVLCDQHVSGVPVVDGDGKPIGVVSAFDVVRVRAYGARYPRPGSVRREADEVSAILKLLAEANETKPSPVRAEPTAGDVMTPATFTVRPTTTLPELARFLDRARIHRALVVDHGQLVGIVTTFDIVSELARHAGTTQVDELPVQDEDVEC